MTQIVTDSFDIELSLAFDELNSGYASSYDSASYTSNYSDSQSYLSPITSSTSSSSSNSAGSSTNTAYIASVQNSVSTGDISFSVDLSDGSGDSVDGVQNIGCGCSSCCGQDGLMYDASSDFNGVSADALVSGVNGKNALDSGYSWDNDGNGLVLDFNFITSLPSFYSIVDAEYRTGFEAMNANQAAASRAVLDVIETYINVTFNEVGAGASADLSFGQVERSNVNVVAHAWYPTGSSVDGDVFLNTSFWGYDTNPQEGDLVYQTLFHEVGHALGLKHSFDSDGSGDTLAAAEENNHYSVMSYTREGGDAKSMMMHDIAWLQELYGVNDSYNTGNNSYTVETGAHYTIWDAGGTDTLNGSAQSQDITFRLGEGELTEIGTTVVGIAFNVEMENATGGSGNDTFYANDLDNVLIGNGGNDTFYGSAGNDDINGGNNTDNIIYSFLSSAFSFNFIDSVTVALTHIADAWTDTLENIESFIFNDNTYTFAELEDAFGEQDNNDAPTLSVEDVNLIINTSIAASTVVDANDADNSTLRYFVWDGTAGNGYFELDGQALSTGVSHALTATEFGNLNIVAGSGAGKDTMWVRVSDGDHTTAWEKFTLNSFMGEVNTVAPTVDASDLSLNMGESTLASTAIDADDVDGNAITYIVWDSTSGRGYFELGGSALNHGTAHELTAAEFATLNIVGGDSAGDDSLWVRVSDGTYMSGWQSFTLTTTGTAEANNFVPSVTTTNIELDVDGSALASTAISASDADGNDLYYEIWDGAAGGGSFELGGSTLAARTAHMLSADDFANLNIVGASTERSDTLSVRVFDGENRTSWTNFTLTTRDIDGSESGGDTNPELTTDNITLGIGVSAAASSAINTNDADGDALLYEVWDATAGRGYFELNGTELAAKRGHTLTEAEFADLNIVGGSGNSTDAMWVRVSDGDTMTGWKRFTLTTSAGGGFEIEDYVDQGSEEQDAINAFLEDTSSSDLDVVEGVSSDDSALGVSADTSASALPEIDTNTDQII